MKDSYSYIIKNPPKKSLARSYELAEQMIPVLISWAQEKRSPQFYGTLSKTIGHNTARISRQLGAIGNIIKRLRKDSGMDDIPLLNALVISQEIQRPSDGLDDVVEGYKSLSEEEKRIKADALNKDAYNYDKWPWVLKALGLMPYQDNPSEESIRKGSYNRGESESAFHKALKKYVLDNPDDFGIEDNNVVERENEHILLSGDRLDVYFLLKDGKQIAVEVKSRISDDADTLRGIYQCVKYKAVLSAECLSHGKKPNTDAILVVEREMSEDNRKTANLLSVKYIAYDKLK